MTLFTPQDPEGLYDEPVETYELALQSVLRWAGRSDMTPGERLRAVRLVAECALAQ